MADLNKDLEKRNALLQSELDITEALVDATKTLETRGRKTANMKKVVDIQKELLSTLESEVGVSSKIESVNSTINDLLMVKLKAGDALSANDEKRINSLVEELSLTNQIAGQIKEQAESFGQETDAQKLSTELKSEALSLLQSSTGAVGDMVAAFAKGGGLIFLLQKAVSFISDMVTTRRSSDLLEMN